MYKSLPFGSLYLCICNWGQIDTKGVLDILIFSLYNFNLYVGWISLCSPTCLFCICICIWVCIWICICICIWVCICTCMRADHLLPRFPPRTPTRLLWPYKCLLPKIIHAWHPCKVNPCVTNTIVISYMYIYVYIVPCTRSSAHGILSIFHWIMSSLNFNKAKPLF